MSRRLPWHLPWHFKVEISGSAREPSMRNEKLDAWIATVRWCSEHSSYTWPARESGSDSSALHEGKNLSLFLMQLSDATGVSCDVGNETAVPCVIRSLVIRVLIYLSKLGHRLFLNRMTCLDYTIRSYSSTETRACISSDHRYRRKLFQWIQIDFLFNFYRALTVVWYISSFISFSKERKERLIQVKANSTLIMFFCIRLCYCRVERNARYLCYCPVERDARYLSRIAFHDVDQLTL